MFDCLAWLYDGFPSAANKRERGMSKHVAVLMGGWSAEREVSLRSGKACADAAGARRLSRHAASMSAAISRPC